MDLALQYEGLKEELHREMDAVFASCDFVLGPTLERFEKILARYCETEFAVGVGSGLDALTISLMAVGLESGEEVIIPANTFIATALAVSAAGGRPVLVDCDPETYNIDVSKVPDALTEQAKAIIPVHLYGQPVDMDPLLHLGKEYGLAVVEDAAQAHGARYKGRRCGSMGSTGCLSFYPGKNLGAYGDGGGDSYLRYLTGSNGSAVA